MNIDTELGPFEMKIVYEFRWADRKFTVAGRRRGGQGIMGGIVGEKGGMEGERIAVERGRRKRKDVWRKDEGGRTYMKKERRKKNKGKKRRK